jgi:hypothetical protein
VIGLDGEKRICSGVDLIIDGLRDLGADRSAEAVMRVVTTAAAASLAECAEAALTVLCGEGPTTRAATSDLQIKVDALQYQHGGHCLDALRGEETVVHAVDLSTESRWPEFTAAVAGLHVRSLLSYRLYLNRADPIGTLNLYARIPRAFTPDAVHAGERLGAYAVVMLAHANEHDKRRNLERALDSNRDIGAAIRILMSRHLHTKRSGAA